MADDDVPKLQRLKGTIESTAGMPVEATSAAGLVEAYNRLRLQALEIAESRDLTDEFESLFPSADDPPERPRHPRNQPGWHKDAEIAAQRASGLLHGLAGWLDGLLGPYQGA
jgi:hypothetical protein